VKYHYPSVHSRRTESGHYNNWHDYTHARGRGIYQMGKVPHLGMAPDSLEPPTLPLQAGRVRALHMLFCFKQLRGLVRYRPSCAEWGNKIVYVPL